MSAQTKYGYSTPIGAAGGIVDVAPHQIDTFLNEEENGVLKFGAGVVQGSKPGVNIALPKKAATAAKFEGITTNNRTTEYDLEGKLAVRKGAAVGVMRYGKIYGRVAEGVEPAYGDSVYLITEGEEAGCFTNEAGTPASGESHQGDPATISEFAGAPRPHTGGVVEHLAYDLAADSGVGAPLHLDEHGKTVLVNEEMVNGEKGWPVWNIAHGLFSTQQVKALALIGGAEQQLRIFRNKLLEVGLCGI